LTARYDPCANPNAFNCPLLVHVCGDSQFLIGRKRATNCVVAYGSRLRCFSNAVVASKGSKESPPELFSVQIPLYAVISRIQYKPSDFPFYRIASAEELTSALAFF
jgi:hypothetical protein